MPRPKAPSAPEPLPPEFGRLTTLALPLATAQNELEALLDSPDYVPQFVLDEMEQQDKLEPLGGAASSRRRA